MGDVPTGPASCSGAGSSTQQDFRCGYCSGWLAPREARAVDIDGVPRYVHADHPLKGGEVPAAGRVRPAI